MRFILIALCFFISSMAVAVEHHFRAIPEKSSIEFVAHTTLFDVTGKFTHWFCDAVMDNDNTTSGHGLLVIKTDSVDTGIQRRDRDLRQKDFFWSKKFPTATFDVQKVTLVEENRIMIQGALRIKDKSKTIEVPAQLHNITVDGKNYKKLSGSVSLNRQDFDINYVSKFFLPTVKDEVDVRFTLLGEEVDLPKKP